MIVVGAGPAGSTAARYAAQRGAKVLLIDRRETIGVPVQCGEFVATDEEIRTIFPRASGLEDLMEVPRRVKRRDTEVIRIWSPANRAWDVPFRGFTVDRDAMDQGLADQAVRAGAELATRTTFLNVRGNEVLTDRGMFQARVVVGADGPGSRVARSVGLPAPVTGPAMNAIVEGDFEPLTHMYFGNLAPGGYAWIIPKDGGANVGLGAWQRFEGNLARLFDLFVRRQGWKPVKGTGGLVPVLGPVARTVCAPVILAGDSAGHVMATNGGGINAAMLAGRIAGEVAAEHVQGGTPLEAYEERWRQVLLGPLEEAARIKRLADRFFGGDRRLELAMRLLGAKRMGRAIRCQPLFRGPREVAKSK